MNKQSLLDAGYREYPLNDWDSHKYADWFLQKRIDDVFGKKFYINAYGYFFTHPADGLFYSSVQFDVQFKLENDECVNVSRSFYHKDCTAYDVEVFFVDVFFSLKAEYYELWSEC